jgi:prophage DNA circulation protein
MGWREDYRQASFRGAPFFVATADSAYGRRVATHEHAQRDVPFNEDMGRKGRGFSVDAYLLGPNYNTARDALIKACETPGPGTLVHPYRGDLTVNCTDLRVSESEAEVSFCRVSMTFIEAGSNSFPKTKIDSVNAISKSALKLEDKSLNGFIKKFTTDGFPGYVLDSAIGTITKIANFLENPGVNLLGSGSAVSQFYAKINILRSGAASLARRPEQLAAAIQNVMRDIRAAFGINSPKALSNTYKEFSKPWSGPVTAPIDPDNPDAPSTPTTPSRVQEKANYVALQDLTRLTAIGESATVAAIVANGGGKSAIAGESSTSTSESGDGSGSGTSGGSSNNNADGSTALPGFETLEAGRETRNELDAVIAIEEEHTADDPVFTSLGALRAEVVKGIPAPDRQLPRLVPYTPTTTQPALKVAQILYNDANRGDEIASRNKVRHPGFLVGREPLEVLADG